MIRACESLELTQPQPDPLTGMLWGGWRAQILAHGHKKGARTLLRLRPHLGFTFLEFRRARGAKVVRLNLTETTEGEQEDWLMRECTPTPLGSESLE